MDRMEELRSELASLADEIRELGGKDEPTEEDTVRLEELIGDHDEKRERLTKLEERERKIEEVREYAARPSTHEAGADRGPTMVSSETRDPFDLSEIRMGSEADQAKEMQSRARQVIEDHIPEYGVWNTEEHRENATKLVDQDKTGSVARHIIETGRPEYVAAFERYAGGEERAALSLTAANGGYLVPFHLDPTVMLQNAGSTNPFRQISRVVSITSNVWHGISTAGVTAEWLPEASEAADASPTFAQPAITVHKAAAWIQASLEVTEDANIAEVIPPLIQDAKDRLEVAAFTTGTGSNQPYGIVTALGLTTASRVAGSSGAAGAAQYVVGDVYALAAALPPRYRPNSSWLGEMGTFLSTRQFGTSNNYHAFWTDLGVATPSMLLGRPVYETSAMDNTVVSGSTDDVLILGDFKNYVIVDRIGLSVLYEPLVKGSNRRPTGEVGWFAFWRVGADSVNDDAFRMLRL